MSCCGSSAALSCCPEKTFVQDKVCSPWSGTGAVAAVTITLYTNNITQNIVGTGYLKFDLGSEAITLVVLDGNGDAIGTPITLDPGSSTTFTFSRFSVIQAVIPAAATGAFQGEFCITTRYSVT
ncbi:hypothetical protein A7K91_12750 [Paenibacillus oryzae]|uniref:Endospore appendages core domain-containing protein n=1 Tax=Paenibacillus oryzae TaxID=1844972 RepID=A0A1A5YFJ8_9BACL|nr:S-Ena type endospore appendage [Paenibacillus oryzae]OBR64369.1 hypothetical protein A7K91_12750 [Paenibacillus oryzae]